MSETTTPRTDIAYESSLDLLPDLCEHYDLELHAKRIREHAELIERDLSAAIRERDSAAARAAHKENALEAALARIAELEKEMDHYAGWRRWKEGIWRVTHPDHQHSAEYLGDRDAAIELLAAEKERGDAWLAAHQSDSVRATSNPDDPNCYRQ